MLRYRPRLFRWILAILIFLSVAVLFTVGVYRLHFDTDVLNALPQNDPVLVDGRYVFRHHPVQGRIVVDLGQPEGDTERLVAAAGLIERRMRESGLFRRVGLESMGRLLPELLRHTVDHLPLLFSAEELERQVVPLLTSEQVRHTLSEHIQSFRSLEGIGQSALIADDPLDFRNLVLSRLSGLSPSEGATIHRGQLLSPDRLHLLIVAEPVKSGMDTRFARQIALFMEQTAQEITEHYGRESGLALTPVGAYRAALDNEINAKKNIRRAITFSTLAIALLLLVGFPRPLIGLLALLPAFIGTMTAVFVYSLFQPSISLMAVGFGGAIIAFTVDYGLTYLLFLDRPYETRGMDTTREVWSLGFLAMLCTATSFAFLGFSGFPVLAEIGLFAALGVIFTYIFVHLVYPVIFPVMPPAKREPLLPLQRFVNRLTSSRSLGKVYGAVLLGLIMLCFARPEFNVNPDSMNAVTKETLKAEQLIRDIWGDIFSKVYILVEGGDARDLQRKCDRLTVLLNREVEGKRISRFFVPSLIFPGEELAGSNLGDWKRFWSPERRKNLKDMLAAEARLLGFSAEAFDSFPERIAGGQISQAKLDLPEHFAGLLGISGIDSGSHRFFVAALVPGPQYDAGVFFRAFSGIDSARVFDPTFFGERLGSVMMSAFIRMAVIVGGITALLTFIILCDWRLALLALLPTVFAMICTLGTLNLLGEPLGVPVVMVSVVIIGMGVVYSLYFVRSYQRYFQDDHPAMGLVRMSVFLSFATTFLGVAVLALSDNAMLKNAGLALALGIGYSFLGAVLIVPPLLGRIFIPVTLPDEPFAPGSARHLARVFTRYRHLDGYPRLFARFKIMIDPMFPRLADFVKSPQVIIDIGTGFGVPAAWLLELHPQARLYGIEPNRKRVAVASRVIGTRGHVQAGLAPDLPEFTGRADTVLLLDMIHMLTDDELFLTLKRVREVLTPTGTVIIRATIPSEQGKRSPWLRKIEGTRIKLEGGVSRFRTAKEIVEILSRGRFQILHQELDSPGREEVWFVAGLHDE
ncbi:MAG: methyltransferase domain-containing protein [Syntrophales bacterium]|jgi:predicted exporter|nr:methyltransferase domain-containing protein [Syntrophales bacterium]